MAAHIAPIIISMIAKSPNEPTIQSLDVLGLLSPPSFRSSFMIVVVPSLFVMTILSSLSTLIEQLSLGSSTVFR